MQELLAAGPSRSTVVAPSAEEPPEAGRHVRRRRPSGVALWLAAGYFVLLVGYSLLVPLFRGPDEMWHIDLSQALSDDLDYPAWDERWLDPGVVEATRVQGRIPLGAHVPRDDRESFDELDDGGPPEARNHMPQHPPLFYAVNGIADRVADAVLPGDPFGRYDTQIWFYRLVGALMVTSLPLIIVHTGTILGAGRSVVLAAAALPLAIPQFFHIGSVVNNDNLLILLGALLVPLLVRIERGEIALWRTLAAGVLTGLALLTKGTAMALPALVALALLLVVWRRRATLAGAVGTGAIYLATAFACGGWWWVRNLVAEGKLAPSLEYDRFSEQSGEPTGIVHFVRSWAYFTNRRFWGDFGYFDGHIPILLVAGATAVAVIGLGWALWRSREAGGLDVADKLVLVGPWVVIALAVAHQAYGFYSTSGQLPLLQGRYWYPALTGLVLLVASGWGNLLGRHARVLPIAFLTGAVVMHAAALRTILSVYWGEPGDGLGGELAAVRDWSPVPPAGLVVLAACALAVLVAMAVAVARQSLGPDAVDADVVDAPTGAPAATAADGITPSGDA